METKLVSANAPVSYENVRDAIVKLGTKDLVEIENGDGDGVKNVASALLPAENLLDDGDLFKLLVSGNFNKGEEEKCRKTLKQALNLDRQDLVGVKVTYHALSHPGGAQIAMAEIIPDNVDESMPPVVFRGGFNSPLSVYLKWWSQYATSFGQRVYIYETPDAGSSRVTKDGVDLKTIIETADIALKWVHERNGKRKIIAAGHSMGTIPLRFLHTGEMIERLVFINPGPPAKADCEMGNCMDLGFSWGLTVQAAGGTLGGPLLPSLREKVLQEQSESDRAPSIKDIQDQRMRTTAGKMLEVFAKVDERPLYKLLLDLNQDVVVIFADRDNLISPLDRGEYKNVLLLKDPKGEKHFDHHFMATETPSELAIRQVGEAINHGVNRDKPYVSPEKEMSRLKFNGFFDLGGAYGRAQGTNSYGGFAGPEGRARYSVNHVLEIDPVAKVLAAVGSDKFHLNASGAVEFLLWNPDKYWTFGPALGAAIGWTPSGGNSHSTLAYVKMAYIVAGLNRLELAAGTDPLADEPNLFVNLSASLLAF